MIKKKNNNYPPKYCFNCSKKISIGAPLYMCLSETFCSKKCRSYFSTSKKLDLFEFQEISALDDPLYHLSPHSGYNIDTIDEPLYHQSPHSSYKIDDDFNNCYLQ